MVNAAMLKPGKVYVSADTYETCGDKFYESPNVFEIISNKNGLADIMYISDRFTQRIYLFGKYYELTRDEEYMAKINAI